MMNTMPPVQTDRGRLRFFTISETRLGESSDGVPVVDSREERFAVEDNGTVRPAREGEVTAFLSQLFHGLPSPTAQSAGSRTGEDR